MAVLFLSRYIKAECCCSGLWLRAGGREQKAEGGRREEGGRRGERGRVEGWSGEDKEGGGERTAGAGTLARV